MVAGNDSGYRRGSPPVPAIPAVVQPGSKPAFGNRRNHKYAGQRRQRRPGIPNHGGINVLVELGFLYVTPARRSSGAPYNRLGLASPHGGAGGPERAA